MKAYLLIVFLMIFLFPFASAATFDHTHKQWDELLKKHVVLISSGNASQTRYAGFKQEHTRLKTYLSELSGVDLKDFDTWTKPQQLAFLINAYNAFTIELILTKYPDLKSIKDTGSLLSNPWKKKFFTLLGEKQHLDGIEHGMIRQKGVYDEPRIHFVVNCASIGCPALLAEAITTEKIDAQLEDSLIRFLSDRSRNRYDANGVLKVSKIFKWYRHDFESGHRGFTSLERLFSMYAHLLADTADAQKKIKDMKADITFLDYDWKLNDASKNP